jgi:hypothetical protein
MCWLHLQDARRQFLCALAVKVDGKPLLVTGVTNPGHDSGICEHACQAEVIG